MSALKNSRHEKFAELCAEGMSGAQAYRTAVSSQCTIDSAMQQASRLLANVKVSSRVAELRQHASDILRDRLGITKETLLRYHVEILETSVGDVGETHRLAQEVSDTEHGRRVKMPSKLEAAKQLATLAGWNAPEKQELTHGVSRELGDILRSVRMRCQGGAAPVGAEELVRPCRTIVTW